jgi:hypothetical protein
VVRKELWKRLLEQYEPNRSALKSHERVNLIASLASAVSHILAISGLNSVNHDVRLSFTELLVEGSSANCFSID